MKYKIIFLLTLLFIVGVGSGVFSAHNPHRYDQDVYSAHSLQKQTVINKPRQPAPNQQPSLASLEKKASTPTASPEQKIPYIVTIVNKKTQTVLESMHYERSIGKLTFTSKEFPSLGTFIESLQGRTNNDGWYWFLYVNGTPSDLGASQKSVAPGDVIEWRYKQDY